MISMIQRLLTVSCIFLLLFSGSAAAAGNVRKSADQAERMKQIRTLLIVPDVRLYQISAGGVKEFREEWSVLGKGQLLKSLSDTLQAGQLAPRILPEGMEKAEAFQDVLALYRAVSTSIRIHTYGETHLFPAKVQQFDYSLGPLEVLLDGTGADAVFFLNAVDEISTAERKALMTAGVIAGALIGVVPVPRGGAHYTYAALVDRQGEVLWFNLLYGGGDLREPEGAAETAKAILAEFPGVSP